MVTGLIYIYRIVIHVDTCYCCIYAVCMGIAVVLSPYIRTFYIYFHYCGTDSENHVTVSTINQGANSLNPNGACIKLGEHITEG